MFSLRWGVISPLGAGWTRFDRATNRVLALSALHDVDESLARRAATLRTQVQRSRAVSAVDAVVVALAERWPDSQIVTSDPDDIDVLADCAESRIRTVRV